MPIQETNGGYKWGKHGKVYPTRAGAAKQARAAYASGYEGYQGGGIIKDSWVRNWLGNMGRMGIMSNPKARQLLPLLMGLKQNVPLKNVGKHYAQQGIMSNPKLRQLLPLIMGLKQNVPLKNIGKHYAQQAARQAGLKSLLKKHGPSALYALTNRGGAFGLGTGGPLGQGVLPSLAANPFGTISRMKYAAANPLLGLLMAGLNKASPQIAGQRGPLGGATGPQLGNLASRMLGIRSTEQAMKDFGPGIMGGTWGPRIRNALGIPQRSGASSIQPITVSAQKRSYPSVSSIAPLNPGAGWDYSMGAAPSYSTPARKK